MQPIMSETKRNNPKSYLTREASQFFLKEKLSNIFGGDSFNTIAITEPFKMKELNIPTNRICKLLKLSDVFRA